MPRTTAFIAAGLLLSLAAFGQLGGQLGGMFGGGLQHPAIQYYTRPVTDPVYRLNRKIQEGEVRLQFAGDQGYLRSLLAALQVPVESQLVVFSKTSLLARLISPQHPRTVFFNDSVVVTWIPGEPFVECAAQDPHQGIIFYTLDDKPPASASDRPVLTRHNGNCLICHQSLGSLGVPGMMVRSVLTSASGTPLSYLGRNFPDDRTPFTERWGGWYITGKRVPAGQRGNVSVAVGSHSSVMTGSAALESLHGLLDSPAYPTPYSDVVAMMVFEHQMHLMNLFTRVGWETRVLLHDSPSRPAETGNLLRDMAGELADYLLFVDEWPLASRVEGSSGFAEKFSAEGPRDKQGRSLRQFDLVHRLMRYPCSYMIYSAAFDGLPADVKAAVYQRMWAILSGQEQGARYAALSLADRQAVVEILRDTKPDLPDYFQPVTR